MSAALLTAMVLFATPLTPPAEPTVEVLLLEKLAPTQARLRAPAIAPIEVRAMGRTLSVDGVAVSEWALPEASWTLELPDSRPRRYRAALRLSALEGRLVVRARIPLEAYVAQVVATESLPGTPLEALKALAVVVRSYALAGAPRHAESSLCDLAHCQALSGGLSNARLAPARRATEQTRGKLLRLKTGAVARGLFHGSCGGHTADATEIFGGDDDSGASPTSDPGCGGRWSAALSVEQFNRAYATAFGGIEPRRLRASDLRLSVGTGGFVRAVTDQRRGTTTLGDRFARALDAETRFRAVRSARFVLRDTPNGIRLEGRGLGHGVGLCQEGAARLARQGMGYQAILRHYYRATLCDASASPSARPPSQPL